MDNPIVVGVVTAYGAAKRAGYTGTYEEFCAEMANLGIEVGHLENMTVNVNMLEPSATASATYAEGVLTLNLPKGETGATGKTAYQYAVDGGYTGTEADFTQLCANLGIEVGHLENMTVVVNQVASSVAPSATYVDGTLTINVPAATDAQVSSAVGTWLDENVDPTTGYVLDRTLTQENAAAPADLVGDLKESFNDFTLGKVLLEFESGSYADADGTTKTNSVARIRNKEPISLKLFSTITLPDGFDEWIFELDSEKTLIRSYMRTWIVGTISNEVFGANTEYINVAIRKTSTPTADISSEVKTINSDTVVVSNNTGRIDLLDSQLRLLNSYNSFIPPTSTKTSNGITFNVNNGVLTAIGTATSDAYVDILSTSLPAAGLKAGGKYYFNSGLKNIKKDGCILIYFNSGSGNVLKYTFVGTQYIEIPEDCVSIIIRYYIYSGSIINVNTTITAPEAQANKYLTNSAEIRFLRAYNIGDSTLIKFRNGETLVIDFGLDEPQGTLQSSWNAAILELNIKHIDYAIISHYHSDHVGMLLAGINSLIDSNTTFFLPNGHAFTAEELEALAWVDEQADDNIVSNYNSVMSVLNTAGCKLVYPSENDTWIIGNAEVKFWNADMSSYMAEYIAHTAYDYNDCSLCNYLTIGSQRIAFTSDASKKVCEKYKTSVLPCQILKVMHHAVGYDVVPLFMNSIMPKTCVTMIGNSLARSRFGTSEFQLWCENNFVPNVVTGINEKTLSLKITDKDYLWNTSCRRCINADEGIT